MPPPADGSLQTARIIWGAMLAALVSYLVVLVLLLGQPGAAPPPGPGSMREIFAVLATVTVAVILYFKRNLPSPDADPARQAPSMPPLTASIACWALAESVALYGLVLGFLLHSLAEASPFFVASAALLLWLRPRADHFDRRAPGA